VFVNLDRTGCLVVEQGQDLAVTSLTHLLCLSPATLPCRLVEGLANVALSAHKGIGDLPGCLVAGISDAPLCSGKHALLLAL
jgi:hypothetical protein